ncbi:MAG: FtsX-like permease family protein [Acidobacteriota bacterium]|nr:MAG: FtsX-like permease family protein [Acidobacteriota bacterium]
MELGPIAKTLIRNKIRFLLIGLEVSLTLAIVLNCINMMQDLQWQIDRPTGLDEEGIIVVRSRPFSQDFREEGYLENSRKADLELMRNLPGVLAADTFSHVPLSGSGSSSGYKPLGAERHTLNCNYFVTGPSGVDTLGVQLIAGRNLTLDDITEAESKNVLITKAYADSLFPDGDALGKQIQGRTAENPDTIVGIIEQMHGSWPSWPFVNNVMIRPGETGSVNWGITYMVRAKPAQINGLARTLEEELLKLNDGRNVRTETLAEVKADTLGTNTAIIKMLAVVIVLLLLVTALGIVGMTSFSVTERTHHIGTRRALGARQVDIMRYFLTENWVITTSGILVGVGLAYTLNYALVTFVNGVKLEWPLVIYGILGMWIIGQTAAFIPAWRGARISPAVATRTV